MEDMDEEVGNITGETFGANEEILEDSEDEDASADIACFLLSTDLVLLLLRTQDGYSRPCQCCKPHPKHS